MCLGASKFLTLCINISMSCTARNRKFTKLYNEPERCVKLYTKLYAVLLELRKVANSSKPVKVRKGNIKVA